MLRNFNVFHASQIDGIPLYEAPALSTANWTPPEAVETIIAKSGAVIRIGGDRASYSPMPAHIQFPPDAAFKGPYECASTKLHALNHWTGKAGRIERPLLGQRNSHAYAFEELVAEIGSALEGAQLGLSCDIPNPASYLSGYVDCLKADKRAIFRAA